MPEPLDYESQTQHDRQSPWPLIVMLLAVLGAIAAPIFIVYLAFAQGLSALGAD